MTGAWYPWTPVKTVLLHNRYTVNYMKQLQYVKRNEKSTLFSHHNGSLLRRQPGALQYVSGCPF